MGDALGKRPFFFWCPVTHRPCRRGKRRPLSKPKHDTKKKHCRQTADRTRQKGGRRPNDAADGQPNSRSEPVAYPTTNDLEDEVWIGKGGECFHWHRGYLRISGHCVCPALCRKPWFHAGMNYALPAPSSNSLTVPAGSSRSRAAMRPPFLCGTPASRRPISIPLSVPISMRSLKFPRCPIRKTLPASFPKPAPRDRSK